VLSYNNELYVLRDIILLEWDIVTLIAHNIQPSTAHNKQFIGSCFGVGLYGKISNPF
jgi:hypothetical protein